MKKLVKSFVLVLAIALMVSASTSAFGTTNQDLQTMLLNALNEERVAQATYQAIIDKFGQIQPFVNILQAETQHVKAIENLINLYGFSIPQNTISVSAPSTLQEAYVLAIKIENEDIALYKEFGTIQDSPVSKVFTNLMNASQEHLKAFTAYLNGQSATNGNGIKSSSNPKFQFQNRQNMNCSNCASLGNRYGKNR